MSTRQMPMLMNFRYIVTCLKHTPDKFQKKSLNMSCGVLKKEELAVKALPSTTLNSMLYKRFSPLQNYQIWLREQNMTYRTRKEE